MFAARITGPEGYVVAFEPQPKLARLISHSLDINGFRPFSNVRDHALGDVLGAGQLGHIRDYYGSASMSKNFGDNAIPKTEVTIMTLDQALKEIAAKNPRYKPPRVIKIDAEGFEYFIWKGMAETVRQADKLSIIMEFAPRRFSSQRQDYRLFLKEMVEASFDLTILGHDGEGPFDPASLEAMVASGGFVELVLRK